MGWLSGYAYRQKIPLKRTDGVVTDYQMKLTVNKTTGSSSGSTVYLKNHALSWTSTVPNDIRFTKANGTTLLDYWIESSDANTATVWIEFDSIGTTDTDFYIYYGKSGDTTTSNGTNTFIKFDDFESYTIGDSPSAAKGWSTEGTGANDKIDVRANPDGDGKVLRFLESGDDVTTKAILAFGSELYPVAVDYDLYLDNLPVGNHSNWYSSLNDSGTSKVLVRWLCQGGVADAIEWYDGSAYHDFNPAVSFAIDTWYKLNHLVYSNDYHLVIDGTDKDGGLCSSLDTGVDQLDIQTTRFDAVTAYINNVKVRNYASPEPTWGTWGSEVTAPTVTTQAVSSIATTTATGNGNITATGGEDASAWGTCLATTANPDTGDTVDAGSGTDGAHVFTTSIDGLTEGTHYHVRAYATNLAGTSYGADVVFNTLTLGKATLAGIGTLTAIGEVFKLGAATLAGIGSLTASAVEILIGKVTLAGTGTLAAIGGFWRFGKATLAGIGSLAIIGQVFKLGVATLFGVGTLAGNAIVTFIGKATLAGTGGLKALATVWTFKLGKATLAGTGRLVVFFTLRSFRKIGSFTGRTIKSFSGRDIQDDGDRFRDIK